MFSFTYLRNIWKANFWYSFRSSSLIDESSSNFKNALLAVLNAPQDVPQSATKHIHVCCFLFFVSGETISYRLDCKLFEREEYPRIPSESMLNVMLLRNYSFWIAVERVYRNDKLQQVARHYRLIAYQKRHLNLLFLHLINLEEHQMPRTIVRHFFFAHLMAFPTEIAAVDFFSFREVVFIAVRYFSINNPQRTNIFFFINNGRFSLLWFSAIWNKREREEISRHWGEDCYSVEQFGCFEIVRWFLIQFNCIEWFILIE